MNQTIGRKLLLSYIIIIVVGGLTLAIAAELHTPTAIARHMNNVGGQMMHRGQHEPMSSDLLANVAQAINEILLVASIAATLAAIVVSAVVTRRITTPIHTMQVASQRIAAGDYSERIAVRSADELGDMATAFNAMATTLEATETRRRQLLGDVAHELRTPLTNIRSVIEGVIDGVLVNDPVILIEIQDEVRRLQRIVADLEALSKAEAGQLSLEKRLVDPTRFIKLAVERLAWQYEQKGVVLHVELPDKLPLIELDEGRMTQVMLNLLGNGLQHTVEGDVVRISAELSPTRLHIHIADTGAGISPDDITHIFERFYRADKSRKRTSGGSGIGLTISKHIVEAHAGSLTAKSGGLNQGSTFTLSLPRP